jgi:predicted nuclease of predicted toxin-antitoxin system
VRFYLDEDLSPRIAATLRRRGIDATSAHEVGGLDRTDREQLAVAANEGRCLVTGNVRHFVHLARRAINEGRPHAGIVLCPARVHRGDIGRTAAALAEITKQYPDGPGPYDVLYL